MKTNTVYVTVRVDYSWDNNYHEDEVRAIALDMAIRPTNELELDGIRVDNVELCDINYED